MGTLTQFVIFGVAFGIAFALVWTFIRRRKERRN